MDTKLVELNKVIPNIILDIKYATEDNFTKQIVYTNNKCYLIDKAAAHLKLASEAFIKLGYKIKIWDAYRPLKFQYVFWELVNDERYVANPKKGSRHNRGCAIDLTLVDHDGIELDMGTSFDDFSQKAHRDFKDLPEIVMQNRILLQEIMQKHKFIGWQNEWWHFDFEDWHKYPILDIDLDQIETKN